MYTSGGTDLRNSSQKMDLGKPAFRIILKPKQTEAPIIATCTAKLRPKQQDTVAHIDRK